MKIGILTFHSQLNYGGVLQCWALQTALEKLGHEVVVIDRWLDNNNYFLERGYDKLNPKQWIKFWIRSLLGLGDINQWLRVRRTKKFIKKYLHLTSYHFVDWKDAPKDIGVDMIVVGSDQVWHCGDWGDPRVYLLEGAPETQAISYAASFGMVAMPKFLSEEGKGRLAEPAYRCGLMKFRAISCREKEGVELCKSLGFKAVHVIDPTLILTRKHWGELVGQRRSEKRRRLVCYFLGTNYKYALAKLKGFSESEDCIVDAQTGFPVE